MPLFATDAPIAAEDIVAKWAQLFPQQPPLRIEKTGGPGGAVQYAAGDAPLIAILIPKPIPGEEVAEAVQTSWMWQQPDANLRAHAAHGIVTTAPAADPIESAWNVSRLSVAMMKAGAGVGLYWGSSRQVHEPMMTEQFVCMEATPPVPLWVGMTISGDSRTGPFSAATHGLASFGHREIEVLRTHMPIADLRTTILDLALYVLKRGAPANGETFGRTATEKWMVRHRASALVPGREVILIGIP